MPPDRPAASTSPAVKAAWAWAAAPSALWIVPSAIPGGNPVTAVPGDTPTSPDTTVEPVLVMVDPARTEKPPMKGQRATGGTPPPWHGPVVKVCRYSNIPGHYGRAGVGDGGSSQDRETSDERTKSYRRHSAALARTGCKGLQILQHPRTLR